MKISAEDIAKALGNGKETRQGPGAWSTLCPAHDDGSPSLSIRDGDAGKILIKCHAGCSQDRVIDELRNRGLWPKKSMSWKALPKAPSGVTPPHDIKHYKFGTPAMRWEYRNRRGELVGYIYRFNHPDGKKDLVPLAYCVSEESGDRAWRWKSFPKPRPLYNEHRLNDNPNQTVVIVEGEKACDAASKLLPDFLCMTWPGGSSAIKLANWEGLKGRNVVIWPDVDAPGAKAGSFLGEILNDIGAKSIKIVHLPEGLPKGWDLADPIPPSVELDPFRTILNAIEFTPSGDVEIDKMNREFALAIAGDKAVVIWERWDDTKSRITPTYHATSAISTYMKNQTVLVGRKEMPIFEYWLTHPGRRSYEGIAFEPGIELKKTYNLWRGFTYTPEPHGDFSLFEEHVRQNVAKGDESLFFWIMGWFAQMLQFPRSKMGTSLAMRGLQGTGKTIVYKNVGALIRDNYVYVDDPRYVLGNFNSHMGHALLLHADEGFFAGDPRHVGRLKGLVTSDTNRIEYKGKESFEINNYMRLGISSNSEWVVPTSFEERRFAVIDVGNGRMQDREYFAALERQLENGGYEGLLHYLLNFDLSTVDVGRIPKTDALLQQKQFSLDMVARYWFERIRDAEITRRVPNWPQFIPAEDLYQDFIDRCQMWGVYRRPPDTIFARELRRLVPNGLPRGRKQIEVVTDQGHHDRVRKWCYELPNINDARAHFEATIETKIEWEVFDHESHGHTQTVSDDLPF